MEKLDTSPEEEAVKDDARQFMSDVLPSAAGDTSTTSSAKGAAIVATWKTLYNNKEADLTKYWSSYDATATSIWKMVYDEAEDNENLADTIDIVTHFMQQPGMAAIKDDCFAVVHTLDSLEIEGLFLFNGPDPEALFGANGETSWYSWSQLGPDATDLVKAAVEAMLAPKNGKLLNGKEIKNTQVF